MLCSTYKHHQHHLPTPPPHQFHKRAQEGRREDVNIHFEFHHCYKHPQPEIHENIKERRIERKRGESTYHVEPMAQLDCITGRK